MADPRLLAVTASPGSPYGTGTSHIRPTIKVPCEPQSSQTHPRLFTTGLIQIYPSNEFSLESFALPRRLCRFEVTKSYYYLHLLHMAPTDLEQLLEMGFEKERSKIALKKAGGCESILNTYSRECLTLTCPYSCTCYRMARCKQRQRFRRAERIRGR